MKYKHYTKCVNNLWEQMTIFSHIVFTWDYIDNEFWS